MNEVRFERQTSRVAEMILGILGSVFGIIGGVFAIMVAGVNDAVGNTGSESVFGLGVAVILVCIVTLIVSCIINKKRVLMGVLLVLGGVLNFIFIGLFGILSGILILVAGILALVRK
ncbi:DUF4064 domain-containing protein [Staphylococcus simulans]|uniref:DUF4064 domain-containing protein n=1 Tax=Staphylococcus simulans TaxID=1286 RepID=UPI00399B8D41